VSTANQTFASSHLRLVDANYLSELRQAPASAGSRAVAQQAPRAATAGNFALRRALVLGVAILIAMVGYLSVSNSSAQATSMAASGNLAHANEFKYITVAPGESLWSIAQKYAPNQDPRDFITALVGLNNLGDSLVQTGQRLALPSSN
jgi:hypothetical protein